MNWTVLSPKMTVFSVPIRFLVINDLLMHVRDDKRLDSNTMLKYGVHVKAVCFDVCAVQILVPLFTCTVN